MDGVGRKSPERHTRPAAAAIEGKLLHAKRNAAQVDRSGKEGGHYHIISITVLDPVTEHGRILSGG